MKRESFVIFLGTLLALAISVAPLGGYVYADGSYDTVVVATGDDTADCERTDLPGVFVTQDVCNIQAAVNAYPSGKILLRGTFYFAEYGADGYVLPGTDGTVFVTNDIEIYGEKQHNKYKTKILGGYNSFSIGYSPVGWSFHVSDEVFSVLENAVQVSVTIQDIEFSNALYTSIRIWATNGVRIKGNRITDGRSLSLEDFYGPGFHATGWGIVGGPPSVFFYDNPQLISGKIEINNNFIDGMYRWANADDPWAVPSYGLPTRGLAQSGIFWIQYEADVIIADNKIYNMGISGISAGGNIGETLIKDNYVYIVSTDELIWDNILGIEVNGAYFYNNYYLSYETAKYEISDNNIVVGNCPVSLGIFVDNSKNFPIVRSNKIDLKSEAYIGVILWDVSNATVSNNKIKGNSNYGVVLGPPSGDYLWLGNDKNIVRENDMNSLNASVTDYYLGDGVTNNSLFVKKFALVLDESGNDTNFVYWSD